MLLARFLQPGDVVRSFGAETEALVERAGGRWRPQLLHSTIGHVGEPKPAKNGETYVHAELPLCAGGPAALFISAPALRRYFYLLESDPPQSLYRVLGVAESASLDQLRFAWRMRVLELQVQGAHPRELLAVDRAFNLLAHPEVRACYDGMCKDADGAAPLFPYGGFGWIVVEGRLADDGLAFFADAILAYKPEMITRPGKSTKVSLLLRRCEFFADRVVCRDPRRKLEVWLDAKLLPGLDWDLTWNPWKHWLRSQIEVEATFVHSGDYRPVKDAWVLRKRLIALPSRLQVKMPDGIAEDVRQARAMHALLGRHAELLRKVRAECDKAPVEHRQIQTWFDAAGASAELKPQHVNWRPEYEEFYFEELRKRSLRWFVFRDEYLFVWQNVVLAEIPASGHATYIFGRPVNLSMRSYSDDGCIPTQWRQNRRSQRHSPNFVTRIAKLSQKFSWLSAVSRLHDQV